MSNLQAELDRARAMNNMLIRQMAEWASLSAPPSGLVQLQPKHAASCELPPATSLRFGDSRPVLVYTKAADTPFVGCYNHNDRCWRVSHFQANNKPVDHVVAWRELPNDDLIADAAPTGR